LLVATASTEAGGTASSTPPPAAATPSAPTGTVSLGGDTRFVIEMGEDGLNVFYLFEITNSSAGPVDPPAPLTFEMPAGAQGTTVLQSTTAKAAANGTRVTATGPFAPGRTTLELAYTLPYAGGRQTIDQALPAALGQLAVIVQKGRPEMRVSSAQFSSQRDMTTDGRQYIIGNGPALAAGGRFVLELTGLPHHSTVPRAVALVLALLLLGAGGWAAFARPDAEAEPRRKKLNARRELLFGHLVKLEEQRQAGAIDPARYAARRRELLSQLERVYGALDEGLAA
jgi:hypothetical protein